jgi:RNA polymerase sigma-70 factor (ECF subfamily)
MHISDAAIRLHRAQVFRYLRRRAGSDDLADDLTQDVFASAAAHLGQLQSDGPLLAWLYRVAQNRLVDEMRARDRRPHLVALTDEASQSEAEFGPLIGAAIRRASVRLAEGDREILGLRLFAGESFAVIANHLNVAEPAAKMRYVRALRRLRDELEKEGVERD